MLAALCLLTATAEAGPVCAVDGTGREVCLEAPARRVVALYGAFNEILVEMGLGGRIVARTKADGDLPAVADLPSIGTHMRPNEEMIVGLGPDLVLQMSGRKEASQAVEALRARGVAVAEFAPGGFAELFAAVRAIGALTGEPAAAAALTERMRARLDAVAQRLRAATDRPRVFFEIRAQSLLAAGPGGIVDEVIGLAGGENAVRDGRRIVRLGEEAVYGLDPDVYVVQRGPMNPDPAPPAGRPLYSRLRAVLRGRVLTVDEQLFSRPGPRSVLAVEQLAAFLHPECFPATDNNKEER